LLEDDCEEQIKEASIRGAQELEVEIAVDIYKMTAAKVASFDIRYCLLVTGRWKCFCVVTATTHQNSEKLPA
jgi:hypothetical protein